MDLRFYMPTEVLFGRGCLQEHGARLKELGQNALIVTGGASSKKNGSLSGVIAALEANGQDFTVYDRVTPNPDLACVREGVALYQSAGADFIVAVGGGSPMDAAKAIALLAVEERSDEDVFKGGYTKAVPMAHVPTTAGTGSEVTPYTVLINSVTNHKQSINCPLIFPRFAFLDAGYTDNLPHTVTVNTALDAFSHAAEGLLATKARPASNMLEEESLRILYPVLKKLACEEPTKEERDALLYASCLAGMGIAQSGTTVVHAMGYYLTGGYEIAHGRANALLLGETLKLCARKGTKELSRVLAATGDSAEGIANTLDSLLGEKERIPKQTLYEYAVDMRGDAKIKRSVFDPTDDEILEIYYNSFGV